MGDRVVMRGKRWKGERGEKVKGRKVKGKRNNEYVTGNEAESVEKTKGDAMGIRSSGKRAESGVCGTESGREGPGKEGGEIGRAHV